MTKPFLLAGAMLIAAPAFAQVNLNTGATVPPGATTTQVEDHSNHNMPAAEPEAVEGATVTQGSEGTTHSHTVTSGTEGNPPAEPEAMGQGSAALTASNRTETTAGARFTGMGGPSVALVDVAGEMLGDPARVERILRGRDTSMKASDLLNSAMLTLIQSGGNAPR